MARVDPPPASVSVGGGGRGSSNRGRGGGAPAAVRRSGRPSADGRTSAPGRIGRGGAGRAAARRGGSPSSSDNDAVDKEGAEEEGDDWEAEAEDEEDGSEEEEEEEGSDDDEEEREVSDDEGEDGEEEGEGADDDEEEDGEAPQDDREDDAEEADEEDPEEEPVVGAPPAKSTDYVQLYDDEPEEQPLEVVREEDMIQPLQPAPLLGDDKAFKVEYGTVVASDIRVPELTVRGMEQSDVDAFVDKMREAGYDWGIGAIKIHYKASPDDGSRGSGSRGSGGSGSRGVGGVGGGTSGSGTQVAFLIDGAHRLSAYLHLHQEGAKGFESPRIGVQVYTRVNGKDLSAADVLILGQRANAAFLVHNPTTQSQQVHWVTNLLIAMQRDEPDLPLRSSNFKIVEVVQMVIANGGRPVGSNGRPLQNESLNRLCRVGLFGLVAPGAIKLIIDYLRASHKAGASKGGSKPGTKAMSIESFASRALLQPAGVDEDDIDAFSIIQLTHAWENTGEVRDGKASRLKGGADTCFFNVHGLFIRAVLHFGRQALGLARKAADDVGAEYGTAAAVAAAAKVRPLAAAALEADASLFELFDLRRPRSQKTVAEELCDLFLGYTAPAASERAVLALVADPFAVEHLEAWERQVKAFVLPPPPPPPPPSRSRARGGGNSGGRAANVKRANLAAPASSKASTKRLERDAASKRAAERAAKRAAERAKERAAAERDEKRAKKRAAAVAASNAESSAAAAKAAQAHATLLREAAALTARKMNTHGWSPERLRDLHATRAHAAQVLAAAGLRETEDGGAGAAAEALAPGVGPAEDAAVQPRAVDDAGAPSDTARAAEAAAAEGAARALDEQTDQVRAADMAAATDEEVMTAFTQAAAAAGSVPHSLAGRKRGREEADRGGGSSEQRSSRRQRTAAGVTGGAAAAPAVAAATPAVGEAAPAAAAAAPVAMAPVGSCPPPAASAPAADVDAPRPQRAAAQRAAARCAAVVVAANKAAVFGTGSDDDSDVAAPSTDTGYKNVFPDVPEPYEDDAPPISTAWTQTAARNRTELERVRVELPAFSILLPGDHQARDFIPLSDWRLAADDAQQYLAAVGRQPVVSAAAPEAWHEDRSGGGGTGTGTGSSGGPNGGASVDASAAGALRVATVLHERGWVVLPHALVAPDTAANVDLLLRFFLDQFPGETRIAAVEAKTLPAAQEPVWAPIHNQDNMGLDAAARLQGQSRLTVLPGAVKSSNDPLEQPVYVAKLQVDLHLAALAHAVISRVGGRTDDSGDVCVRVPTTGARMLLTTSKAMPQHPHVDSNPTATVPSPLPAHLASVPEAVAEAAAAEVLARGPALAAAAGMDGGGDGGSGDNPTPPFPLLTQLPEDWSRLRRPAPVSGDGGGGAGGRASDGGGSALPGMPPPPPPLSPLPPLSPPPPPPPPPPPAGAASSGDPPVYSVRPSLNYFVMATGADGSWVRAWPSSVQVLQHVLAGQTQRRAVYPELVFIPPFSVAIMRGDVVHGGAGAADNPARAAAVKAGDKDAFNYSHCIRLHMYVQDKEVPLDNAIHLALPRHVFCT